MTIRLKSGSPHHIIIEPWNEQDRSLGEARLNEIMENQGQALFEFIQYKLPFRTSRKLKSLLNGGH